MSGRRGAEPNALAMPWRLALALAAVAVAGFGVWLLLWPPKHTEFAPQATSAAQRARVSEASPTSAALVIAIGALLLLVAANGRKIANVKLGDDEVGFALSRKAATSAALKAKEKGLTPDETATAVLKALDDTAVRVQAEGASALDVDEIARNAVTAASRSG